MKWRCVFFALVAVTAALGLTACGSAVERRIRKDPSAFATLSERDKIAVQAGRIREGMSPAAVRLAWGTPARISEGKRNGRIYERWTYVEFDAVVTHGYGSPYGYHVRSGYYGAGDPYYATPPVVNYIPRDGAFVEFVDGVVTGWALPTQ